MWARRRCVSPSLLVDSEHCKFCHKLAPCPKILSPTKLALILSHFEHAVVELVAVQCVNAAAKEKSLLADGFRGRKHEMVSAVQHIVVLIPLRFNSQSASCSVTS